MTTKIRVLLVEPSPLLGIKLTALFGRKLERVAGPVTAAGMVSAVRDFEPQVVLLRVDGPSSEVSRAIELVMSAVTQTSSGTITRVAPRPLSIGRSTVCPARNG